VHETAHVEQREIPGGQIAFGVFVAAWAVILGLFLTHSIVLSSDSINNHVHVWWIARELWHHGHLPLHYPLLGHGDALAYPYGFVNWTTAALLWPLFGNWAVTLTTALGAGGCIVATFVAFPELRRGYWAAAVLANPALLQALLFSQQSFAWAAMFLLFGIAAWRRERRLLAAILVGIAQLTHVVIVGPMALVVVLLYLPFTKDRWAVVRWYALACVIALPAFAMVLTSPGYSDANPSSQIVNFFATLGPRILIVVLPWFYTLLKLAKRPVLAPLALLLSLIGCVALEFPLNVNAQWSALWHHGLSDTASLDAYLRSPNFEKGATYRVLRGGDGKLGLYRVVQAGGQLDSELFPESMAIKNFTLDEYQQLLCERHIDQIIHYNTYDTARRTNEHDVIAQLAATAGDRVSLRGITSGPGYQIYAVDRSHC
jgi:hypothetical protein